MLALDNFAEAEVYPFAHLEIIILREDPSQANLTQAAADFARLLHEKGLRPSQRVCTVAECLGMAEQSVDFGRMLRIVGCLLVTLPWRRKLEDELVGFFTRRQPQQCSDSSR